MQDGLVHIYCQKKLETAPSIQGISSSSNTPEKLCSAFLEKLIRENLCLTLLFVSQWQLSCLILGRRICRYKLWEFYGLTFMWFDICACSTFLDLNSLAFIYFFSTSTFYNLTAKPFFHLLRFSSCQAKLHLWILVSKLLQIGHSVLSVVYLVLFITRNTILYPNHRLNFLLVIVFKLWFAPWRHCWLFLSVLAKLICISLLILRAKSYIHNLGRTHMHSDSCKLLYFI